MESTETIISRTGITPRTLTRWHAEGVIAKPVIKTHPGGRGKMAFYVDGTAERVEKLMSFKKNGYTPRQAATMLAAEEKRGDVPDDFAIPIYKGTHEDVVDLIAWILRRQAKGAKRYYVGIEWIGNQCVAYVDEHIAHEITHEYFKEIIAAYREATSGKKGDGA